MNDKPYKIVLIHRFEKSAKTKTFKDITTATNWMFQRVIKMNTPYGNWYWEIVYRE